MIRKCAPGVLASMLEKIQDKALDTKIELDPAAKLEALWARVLAEPDTDNYAGLTSAELAASTCAQCRAAPKCEFAFDSYNTHGDCLAEK